MKADGICHGQMRLPRGAYYVVGYEVWRVHSRDRDGFGAAMLMARFARKRHAQQWAKQMAEVKRG